MSHPLEKTWIWSPGRRKNHYVLFHKTVSVPRDVSRLWITITASYHYEFYLNGSFLRRGPVHGDPAHQSVDTFSAELPYPCPENDLNEANRLMEIAIVVHHVTGTTLSYVTPAPPGLACIIRWPGSFLNTDESWQCLDLSMWSGDSPERALCLDYIEDYHAEFEPEGWNEMRFRPSPEHGWKHAVPLPEKENLWSGYHERKVPFLERLNREPARFRAWSSRENGPENPFDISKLHDEEELTPVTSWLAWDKKLFQDLQGEANVFTMDLGEEFVGFYRFTTLAPAGTVIEVSGAELLQDGKRPWIFRKGKCYSIRYTCSGGRHTFRSFSWNGFRFIHVVIRRAGTKKNPAAPFPAEPLIENVSCVQRRAQLPVSPLTPPPDRQLASIFSLCLNTPAKGVQEQLIDCPTREQTPAWADSVFIAQGLWTGFSEKSYLCKYLDMYIQAPINENGMINARYPSTLPQSIWLDMCLIPVLGQDFFRRKTGSYYRACVFLDKALELKKWFDGNTNSRGLIDFPFREYWEKKFRNFVDHPGLHMHDAPHPGIDRDGISCPLNSFFYGFLLILSDMAAFSGRPETEKLLNQASALKEAIRGTFWDGSVFHDTVSEDGTLSEGTSWQTNSLAVYMGIPDPPSSRSAMEKMIAGYSTLCRCTPYFHYYFLPALRRCGMDGEAKELIKKEWGVMTAAGATTTWETFLGNERDSLFHLWGTAPLNYLGDPDDTGISVTLPG